MSEAATEEIERLRKAITDLVSTFPSVPRELSPQQKGEWLLDAFLNDKPFDRHAFGFIEVKKEFLKAAFNTRDQEIITGAMFLVRQTLKEKAFSDLINSDPRFKTTYTALTRLNSPLVLNSSGSENDRLVTLRAELAKTKSQIVQSVLRAEIQKIEKHDPWCGCHEVDKRWAAMVRARASCEYTKFNPKELTRAGWFNKWQDAVNPAQAAIITKYWNMPCGIPESFAALVKDKKERAVLVARGVVPA